MTMWLPAADGHRGPVYRRLPIHRHGRPTGHAAGRCRGCRDRALADHLGVTVTTLPAPTRRRRGAGVFRGMSAAHLHSRAESEEPAGESGTLDSQRQRLMPERNVSPRRTCSRRVAAVDAAARLRAPRWPPAPSSGDGGMAGGLGLATIPSGSRSLPGTTRVGDRVRRPAQACETVLRRSSLRRGAGARAPAAPAHARRGDTTPRACVPTPRRRLPQDAGARALLHSALQTPRQHDVREAAPADRAVAAATG